MLYKVHISVITVSAFSWCATILTLTGKLKTVMLSWSLRGQTTSCLGKVVAVMESKHGKCYENLCMWSDGIGDQFRSCFVFTLLAGTLLLNKSLMWFDNECHHGKGPMDGVGRTMKNIVFRKVKSGQVVINSLQEFSEAVKKIVISINAVYLSKSESIIKPKDTECAKKIKDTLKVHKLESKFNANGNLYINFYKNDDDDDAMFSSMVVKMI